MNHPSLPEKLKQTLLSGLPGLDQQMKMAPLGERRYSSVVPDDVRRAAVMMLLYPDNGAWHILYIKRSSDNPNDKHSGQISLPGGKLETTDKDMLDCSLRETFEEIGIPAASVNVIGALTPLYVFVSNFLVDPFLGYLNEKPTLKLQKSEVAEVLHIPIKHLLDKNTVKSKEIQVRNITLKDVPYYDLNGHTLWGATAMITSEFLKIYESTITK